MDEEITVDEILDCKKNSDIRRLAKKFREKVNFEGAHDIDDFKSRLLLALKKEKGQMKDIESLTSLFESVQAAYLERSNTLNEHFKKVETIFKNIGDQDAIALLGFEEDPQKSITLHQNLLGQNKCPIVVAGEVSSGKSTLLNLFLGKCELQLPMSTLSCTGRVCELSYGKKLCAVLRKRNGSREEIPLARLRETIDMHGQTSDSFNKYDVVQISLPIPFLKSGITLVDTPGIGDNPEDSAIVTEYVKTHDVFGFIFTIHSSAGGGVNQKFQNLLQQLAGDDYLDGNGQRKLHPKSVVFCCNFWDEVSKKDKGETAKLVTETIKSKPFLSGFDGDKQLFFMDSKSSYAIWQRGYITSQFDHFIDGMKDFFICGQIRKLNLSYIHLENILDRSLHSMRSYLFWAKQQKKLGRKRQEELQKKILTIEDAIQKKENMLHEIIGGQVDLLSKKMLEFLQKNETKNRIFTWSAVSLYILQGDKGMNNKEVFEYKLDELIDERISEVLLCWEQENQYVNRCQHLLAEVIRSTLHNIEKAVEKFERIISSNSRASLTNSEEECIDLDEDNMNIEDLEKALAPACKENFDVVFGKTFGSSLSLRETLPGTNMLFGLLKNPKAQNYIRIPERSSKTFKEDMIKHMRHRSKAILEKISTIDFTKEMIAKQMTGLTAYLDKSVLKVQKKLGQNKKLVNNLRNEINNVIGSSTWCEEYTSKLRETFDTLLLYGIEELGNQTQDINITHPQGKETSMPAGMFGMIVHAYVTDTMEKVTVKKLEICETDKYYMLNILRSFQKSPYIPVLLGTYYDGRPVFHGHCITAKNHFSSKKRSVERFHYEVLLSSFLLELGHAIQFLHHQNLVHIELSPDSVLVKDDVSLLHPLLTSLTEKKEVKFLDDAEDRMTSNSLYLPPEVLSKSSSNSVDHWYSDKGDLYGLGLVILELWCQDQDLFLNRLNGPFNEWRSVSDPGHLLLSENSEQLEQIPKDIRHVIELLLKKDPNERITAKQFLEHYEKIDKTIRASDKHSTEKDSKELNPVPKKDEELELMDSLSSQTQEENGIHPPKHQGPKHIHYTQKEIETLGRQAGKNLQIKDEKYETRLKTSNGGQSENQEKISRTKKNYLAKTDKAMLQTKGKGLLQLMETVADYKDYTQAANVKNMADTHILSDFDEDQSRMLHDSNFEFEGICATNASGIETEFWDSFTNTSYDKRISNLEDAIGPGAAINRLLWCEMPEVKESGLCKDMTKAEQRMQEALFEIMSSELSYMKSLNTFVKEIMFKIEMDCGIKKKSMEYRHVFSNISKVYAVTEKLFHMFEHIWRNDILLDPEIICSQITGYFEIQQNIEVYLVYFSNFRYQKKMLDELVKRNKEFAVFTKGKFSLNDSYFILPFQRIPRYKILLEAVVKALPDDGILEPAHQAVEKCLENMIQFADQCNNAVKKMDDLEYMIELEKRLEFGKLKVIPVISPKHEAKQKGLMELLLQNPTIIQKLKRATEPWEIHMFTDVIIFGRTRKNGQLEVQYYCDPTQVSASEITSTEVSTIIQRGIPQDLKYFLKVEFFPSSDDVCDMSDTLYIFAFKEPDAVVRWSEVLSPFISTIDKEYGDIDCIKPVDNLLVQVFQGYTARQGDELTLYESEIIRVLRKVADTDWWEGEKLKNLEKGWFPASHTKEIKNAEQKRKILMEENKVLMMTTRIQATQKPVHFHSVDDLKMLNSKMKVSFDC